MAKEFASRTHFVHLRNVTKVGSALDSHKSNGKSNEKNMMKHEMETGSICGVIGIDDEGMGMKCM